MELYITGDTHGDFSLSLIHILACPFPLLSIFLHFPIDFLFADFTSVPAWANSLMASWMA